MLDKTKELITNGTKVICEATFKKSIFAIADILVKIVESCENDNSFRVLRIEI